MHQPPQRRHPSRSRSLCLCWALLVFLLTLTACSGRPGASTKPGRVQKGLASWYGEPFHGRATASGEIFDMHGLSAAHKELPLGTRVEVTNLDNGRRLEVRINDRGPFVRGRIIDLSYGAAQRLDMVRAGVVRVELRVLEAPHTEGRYTIQAGAFRTESKAKDLQKQLRKQGYEPVRVHAYEGWYRVRVGAFDSRKRAQDKARALRRQGLEAVVLQP